ncbi:hypothetical protein D1872_299630 [compost metagenome]
MVRLIVDISITRPRAHKGILDEVIEAAIAVAERVFEAEINKAVGKGASRGAEKR